jgi:hypothetical protein
MSSYASITSDKLSRLIGTPHTPVVIDVRLDEDFDAWVNDLTVPPFDAENVFWSHRCDRCTFDIMIEEFVLATPAMLRPRRNGAGSRYGTARPVAGSSRIAGGFARAVAHVR